MQPGLSSAGDGVAEHSSSAAAPDVTQQERGATSDKTDVTPQEYVVTSDRSDATPQEDVVTSGGGDATPVGCDVTPSGGDATPGGCGVTVDPAEAAAALRAPAGGPVPVEAARRFMDAAFAAARDALRHQEVPVGCVLARAGRLLAAGRNTVNATKNATRHAELNCMDAVYRLCGEAGADAAAAWAAVDVFVTVEPCVMCAAALVELGVRSVTFGCANQRFGGCGSVLDVPGRLLRSRVRFAQDAARVDEAVTLLKEFYKGENPNVPRGP